MIVHVAVPVPGLGLLTYRVPDELPRPVVGSRVVVPLGNRIVTGIVMDDVSATSIADEAVKPVREVLDTAAFVPPEVVALAQWTAEYYAAGPGDTITAVLPPMARGGRQDAHKTVRVAAITAAGLDLVGGGDPGVALCTSQTESVGRPFQGRQLEALQLLAGTPSGITTPELATRGITADAIARLARRGLISLRADRVDRDPFDVAAARDVDVDLTRPLTREQESAVTRLRAFVEAGRFKVALLHGVTGSGKTEIYLRVALCVRDAGRRTLLLVPEIALTPVVTSLFREAFGNRVAIQHSGLSDGERHDQWQRIRHGEVDVVVGTRSAVFAPIQDVGAIIVDEEHDGSYKQEESPRYNGRDVAIVRAQRAEALVVLGSATPSMESYHNAMSDRYERIVLERRVLDRPLAAVSVVDMRDEYADRGPDVVISRALSDALTLRLERHEQALVLLNRRGFATAIFCRQCAGTMDCPNCSVSLVVHGEGPSRRARCHYCNYTMRVPPACPKCAGPYLEQAGFGTERVEAEVKRVAPNARVARLDRDAIRRKGALTSILSRFRSGEIDVLVGTQMIAKGHDFPRVTLVGVVSADVGLGLADFRASERTFQLLTQVVGRAGRGDEPGEAIVQTIYPDHYSIQLAREQNYRAFFDKEIDFRRKMRYPPLVAMINTIVRARTFGGAMDDAGDLVQRLRQRADEAGLRILGPAPAPLGKLRGEYRTQVLIKGTNRRAMREALRAALSTRPDLERRIVVDVDPVSVL
ncbi:MAG TPA: primosomal protein N' [Vicinamibacterales bacterium]|nr:primosomal protein N' [Vicinamibacterales bacterium]